MIKIITISHLRRKLHQVIADCIVNRVEYQICRYSQHLATLRPIHQRDAFIEFNLKINKQRMRFHKRKH